LQIKIKVRRKEIKILIKILETPGKDPKKSRGQKETLKRPIICYIVCNIANLIKCEKIEMIIYQNIQFQG